METVRSVRQQPQQRDTDREREQLHENIDCVTRTLSELGIRNAEDQQLLSDDQGIGQSVSSTPSGSQEDLSYGYREDDEHFEGEENLSANQFIECLIAQVEMALDLRKNPAKNAAEADLKQEPSGDNDIALDLTARTPVTHNLPAAAEPVKEGNPIKLLSDAEKSDLRKALLAVFRFLRPDSPSQPPFRADKQFPSVTIRQLQSFLLMYLIEVKRKTNSLTVFQKAFSSDEAIHELFLFMYSRLKPVPRTTSAPAAHASVPSGGLPYHSLIRSSRFSLKPDTLVQSQLIARGPNNTNDRHRVISAAQSSAAPYPPRRNDFSGGIPSSSHGLRASQQQYRHSSEQQPVADHVCYQLAASNLTQHVHLHPNFVQKPPNGDILEWNEIREVLTWLNKDLPSNIQGLSEDDFMELYGSPPESYFFGTDQSPLSAASPPETEYKYDMECRTPLYPNSVESLSTPNSPPSPWTSPTSCPTSPTSSVLSCSTPIYQGAAFSSSASNSPAPASPGGRIAENMKVMTLIQPPKSQPPPLLPIDKSCPPAVRKYETACEELTASLNQDIKDQMMHKLVSWPIEDLTKPDADGDTPLMVACANPTIRNEDLYSLVEWLKRPPNPAQYFTACNKKRETALYLAVCERRPLVAGYLAETMSSLGIPLNQTYQKGNSLIHEVSSWGDHQMLKYLVRVRAADKTKLAFDLNATNREGRSALHEAVSMYQRNDPTAKDYLKTVQLLLDYGADAGLSDKTSGKTPVHIAIEKRDSELLELLLSKCPDAANAAMYNDNRPLHSAATLSGVTDVQQLELVNILLKYGADKTLRNKANKLPIELVQQDRDRVKAVLQARSRQNVPLYGGV